MRSVQGRCYNANQNTKSITKLKACVNNKTKSAKETIAKHCKAKITKSLRTNIKMAYRRRIKQQIGCRKVQLASRILEYECCAENHKD